MKKTSLIALLMICIVTGCKEDKPQATGGDGSKGGDKKDRVVNVAIFSEYLPQEVRDEFTKKTGIKINVAEVENNEKLIGELQTGVSTYDLVVLSDYAVQSLKRQNLLGKIDQAKIANWKHLNPKLLGQSFDPRNEYSMPYMYGTTGIGYAKAAHPTVDSWKVMFDEKNAGKILMLDDSRECMAAALKVMGKSINEKDPAVLKQAGDMLKAQKKLVKAYDADDFSGVLERGDVTLAHGFNGQLAKVVAKDKNKFGFVVPKEGATLWIDTFCLPAKARNTAEAHDLLNFILEPEVNARIVNEVSYASSNLAAKKLVKPEIGNDPSVYPPDDVIARCEMMVDLGDDVMAIIDKIWEEVTAK